MLTTKLSPPRSGKLGSASISLFGPKCLRGVFVEDNQSTIRILESGKSPAFRHTDKTQRVNLAWLAEQFRRKHYQLVHAGTVRQSADICTKPFTNSDKWKNALKLISHTNLKFRYIEESRIVPQDGRTHRGTCCRGTRPNSQMHHRSVLWGGIKARRRSSDPLLRDVRYSGSPSITTSLRVKTERLLLSLRNNFNTY